MKVSAKEVIKVSLAFTACLIGFIIFQAADTSDKVTKAREAAIAEWVEASPENKDAASRYINICLKTSSGFDDRLTQDSSMPKMRPSECIKRHAPEALAKVIDGAQRSVEAPAPLRWF